MHTTLRPSCHALALTLALGAPLTAQTMVFALSSESDSHHDIWVVDDDAGSAVLAAADLELVDVKLVGWAKKDGFRLDCPAERDWDALKSFIHLLGGGALYRANQGPDSVLLSIDADGNVSIPLSVARGAGDGLKKEVHVSADGTTELIASDEDSGGDVFVIDLVTHSSFSITEALPAMKIKGKSLRTSSNGSWFVSDGTLYRSIDGGQASVVALPWPDKPEDEPVLSADGERLAVLVDAGSGKSRIAVVDRLGDAFAVVSTVGKYQKPKYRDDFGPKLLLNDDGSRLAYFETVSPDDAMELYVCDVTSPGTPIHHITTEPDYPVYIDNGGILAFSALDVLCFFAGDQELSEVGGKKVMGAADMYATTFSNDGSPPVSVNVSATSGQTAPPFTIVSTLNIRRAIVNPHGTDFIIAGESPTLGKMLQTFSVTAPPAPLAVSDLASSSGDFTVIPAGDATLVLATNDEPDEGIMGELFWLKSDGMTSSFVSLAQIPEGITVDRFAASHATYWTAAVASADEFPGFEVPLMIHTTSGILSPAVPFTMAISPCIAFDSAGRLVAGFGDVDGPYRFASFTTPNAPKLVSLPPVSGFPMQF